MNEEDESYFMIKATRSTFGMKNENVIFGVPMEGECCLLNNFETFY